jgi:type II secretory pathway pseudopilin PulG
MIISEKLNPAKFFIKQDHCNLFNRSKKESGLTMVELLTVVSIILILSAVVFGNYQVGNNTQALDRAAQKLAQDFRRVNEMSVSGQEMTSTINAYGIYFNKTDVASPSNSKTYIVYKNTKNGTDYQYNSSNPNADTISQTISMEAGIKICDILDNAASVTTISIGFVPPEPVVFMGANSTGHEVTIKLGAVSDNCASTAKFKFVRINHVGRVDVANQ